MKYNKTSYIKNEYENNTNYTQITEEKIIYPDINDYFIYTKKKQNKFSINDGLFIDYSKYENFIMPQHIKYYYIHKGFLFQFQI